MINFNELKPISAELSEQLSGKQKRINLSPTGTSAILTGNRNSRLASIAGSIRRNGGNEQQIMFALMGVNSTLPEPLSSDEVGGIVRSIGQYPTPILDAFTHQGFADFFCNVHHGRLKYVEGQGFLHFNGMYWENDPEGLRATRLQIRIADELKTKSLVEIDAMGDLKEAEKATKKLNLLKDTNFLNKSLKLIRVDERVHTGREQFNPLSHLLNFMNGTLDLETMTLRPHDATDGFKGHVGFDFDPAAKCPMFDKLLSSSLPKDHAAFFMRVMGYAMSGTGKEQKVFFILGKGSNGKSTIMEAISDVFGEYSVGLQAESLTGKLDGQIRSDLARLDGKKLVLVNETRQGSVLDSPLLKQITGGDKLTARHLFQAYYDFRPHCVPVLLSNYFPVLDGSDFAMGRRVCIIPFLNEVKNPDYDLPRKLEAEKQGIMNRILEGLADYQKNGLSQPEGILAITKKLIDGRNLLLLFINDYLTLDDKAEGIAANSLYNLYRSWCIQEGCKPPSQSSFKESFERQTGLKQTRKNDARFWPGVERRKPGS